MLAQFPEAVTRDAGSGYSLPFWYILYGNYIRYYDAAHRAFDE